MRALIQRVISGKVTVGSRTVGEIKTNRGLVVLVGIQRHDTKADRDYMTRKILNIRLFEDEKGRPWTKSAKDLNLDILVVSQFTLYANLKGNKPDFHNAMNPTDARQFYHQFLSELRAAYHPDKIHDGEFGEMMQVHLINDGPVTIPLDSRKFVYADEVAAAANSDSTRETPSSKSAEEKVATDQ